jgi:hypothetical protein
MADNNYLEVEDSFFTRPYSQPGQGGNSAISQLLGQLSPGLGSAFQASGIGNQIFNGLGNFASTRGSFSTYTNPANIMLNQAQNRVYANMMQNSQELGKQQQQQMLSQFYTNMGFKNANERASSWLNPVGSLASIGVNAGYELSAMNTGFRDAAFHGGVFANTPAMSLSGAERSFFGTRQGEVRSRMRSGQFGNLFAAVQGGYLDDPSQYGGLGGGEIGQITAQLSRAGKLEDVLADFGAGGDIGRGTSKVNERVKGMAKALGPMKELFGGSIPQLMSQLDNIFGVSATTFSPQAIQSRVLQLKHTARMSGTSVQTLMSMQQSAQGYLESMGAGPMGATQAALNASYAIGASGVNIDRVNESSLRQNILKNATGRIGSRMGRDLAGAYVLFRERAGVQAGTQADSDLNAKFRSQIMGGSMDINSLSAKFGFSQQDIRTASMGEAAQDVLATTSMAQDLGGDTYGRYRRAALRSSRSYLSDQGIRLSAKELAGIDIRDSEGTLALLRSRGGGEKDLAALQNYFESSAQWMTGMGFRETEAERAKILQGRELEGRITGRGRFEASLGGVSFGVKGIMQALSSKDPTVSKFIKGAFGLAGIGTVNKEAGAMFDKALSGLTGDARTKAERRLNAVFQAGLHGIDTSGNLLSEDAQKKALMAIQSGDLSEVNLSARDITKEGQREKALEDIGKTVGVDFLGQLTGAKGAKARNKVLTRAVIAGAIDKVKGVDKEALLEKLKTADLKTLNIDKFIEDNELEGEAAKSFKEGVTATEKLLNITTPTEQTNDILKKILDIVTAAVNK